MSVHEQRERAEQRFMEGAASAEIQTRPSDPLVRAGLTLQAMQVEVGILIGDALWAIAEQLERANNDGWAR